MPGQNVRDMLANGPVLKRQSPSDPLAPFYRSSALGGDVARRDRNRPLDEPLRFHFTVIARNGPFGVESPGKLRRSESGDGRILISKLMVRPANG